MAPSGFGVVMAPIGFSIGTPVTLECDSRIECNRSYTRSGLYCPSRRHYIEEIHFAALAARLLRDPELLRPGLVGCTPRSKRPPPTCSARCGRSAGPAFRDWREVANF